MEQALNSYILHFILIFSRLASAFTLFPVIGNRYIFSRAKWALAFTTTIVILPLINDKLPPYTEDFSYIALCIIIEILTGVLISISAMIFYQIANILGHIIAMQSGLGAAAFFDPNQQAQLSVFSNLFMLLLSATLLASDAHYIFLDAIISSYDKFPAGSMFSTSDASEFLAKVVNECFVMSFKIASPFIVVSFAIMTGSGILSRLMPNFQVFFVITPAQILVMMGIIYVTLIPMINKISSIIQDSLL